MPAKRRVLAFAEPLDQFDRWYLEIPTLPPDKRAAVESYPALECADCSAPIRHGIDRHFVRAARPTDVVEPVCGACADRQLAES